MNGTRSFQRLTAFLVGLVFGAAALSSTVVAGSDANPEIKDWAGDVNPLAVILQVPPEAGIVDHAELYDLVKAYVAGEDQDAFFIRIVVSDLPDDWILQPGPANGQPIAPIKIDAAEVRWDDSWFNSKVNITSHFLVKGKNYRAVATLAELNLENPNAFPEVYSRQLASERLTQARLALDGAYAQAKGLNLPVSTLNPKQEILDAIADVRRNISLAHATLNESDPWSEAPDARVEFHNLLVEAKKAGDEVDLIIATHVPAGTARDQMLAGFALIEAKLSEVQALIGSYTWGQLHWYFETLKGVIRTQAAELDNALGAFLGAAAPKTTLQETLAEAEAKTDEAIAIMDASDAWSAGPDTQDRLEEILEDIDEELQEASDLVDTLLPSGSAQTQLDARFALLMSHVADAHELVDALPVLQVDGSGPVGAPADAKAPRVLLFHRFALFDEANRSVALDGLLDLKLDIIQMRIPKANVGSPVVNDMLSKFRVVSSFRDRIMDFAPNATSASPTDPAPSLVLDAAKGQLVKPAFGADYRFAYQPAGPAPTSSPGVPTTSVSVPAPTTSASEPGRVVLVPVGAVSQEIRAGGLATYYFTLRNEGGSSIAGLFSLSSAAAGWTHQLSESSWSLAPGSSTSITLTVSAVDGGALNQVSEVIVSQTGGQSQRLAFTTTLVPTALDSDDGADEPSKGSPGFEIVGVLAAIAAMVALTRRRR